MKTIKITLFALAATLALVSCKKGGVFCYHANGDIVNETRSETGFTGIDLAMAADLHVTQSPNYSITISASENLMSIIETEVKGNQLLIDVKKRKCISGNSDVDVYVTAPQISSLSVSGSGTIDAPNLLTSSNLKIDISGSGKINIDSLSCNDFDANISGSGEMTVNGTDTTNYQNIDISGSGSFRGFNMPARTSNVTISGSGECELNVIDKITARISGSGRVRYIGTPVVDSDISGSGSIKQY